MFLPNYKLHVSGHKLSKDVYNDVKHILGHLQSKSPSNSRMKVVINCSPAEVDAQIEIQCAENDFGSRVAGEDVIDVIKKSEKEILEKLRNWSANRDMA